MSMDIKMNSNKLVEDFKTYVKSSNFKFESLEKEFVWKNRDKHNYFLIVVEMFNYYELFDKDEDYDIWRIFNLFGKNYETCNAYVKIKGVHNGTGVITWNNEIEQVFLTTVKCEKYLTSEEISLIDDAY